MRVGSCVDVQEAEEIPLGVQSGGNTLGGDAIKAHTRQQPAKATVIVTSAERMLALKSKTKALDICRLARPGSLLGRSDLFAPICCSMLSDEQ